MKLPMLLRLTMLLVVAATGAADAQVDSSLAGQRVRVRFSEAHRQAPLAPAFLELRGTVTTASPDTLTLLLSGTQTTVTVPTRVMTGLAISRGIPGRAESGARGAVRGALHGAVLGGIYLLGPVRNYGHTWEDAIGTGVSVGALTGLLMGVISPHERWHGIKLR